MRYMTRRLALTTTVPSLLAFASLTSIVRAQDPAPAATQPNPAGPPPAAPVEAAAAQPATAPVEVAPAPVAAPGAFDVQVDWGVGIRTELGFDPDEDPGPMDPPDEDGPFYAVGTNVRPYIAGQVHEYIKFEGNLDSDGLANIRVLDGVVKFEFHEYFNLWVGHFLPPSDRANLSGPYFQNAWTYPLGVHTYASDYAGRDDGLAMWGQVNGGQFKWQLGFFGMGPVGGTANPTFSGRVVYNVFDPEPGYYNSSTYYGTKDILAFGAALRHQPAPEGADDEAADTNWNLDALFEKTFAGAGTLDVEGAFYGFGGSEEGTSFSILGSFLFPDRIGIGQLQPMIRLQRVGWSDGDTFDTQYFGALTAPDGVDISQLTIDAGLHYIINGHNLRLAATVQHSSLSADDADSITNTILLLGAQLQAF
jgi:hypothetical protein